MNRHRCRATWPEMQMPTGLDVLLALDQATTTWCDPCRINYAHGLVRAAEEGDRCEQAGHHFLLDEKQRTQDAVAYWIRAATRYQQAWRSARRRGVWVLMRKLDEQEVARPKPGTAEWAVEEYADVLEHQCPDCSAAAGALCDSNGVWVHLERMRLARD